MGQLGRTTLPWESTLDKLDTEELRHLAAQAEEMTSHPAWERLCSLTERWIELMQESLLPPATPEQTRFISVTAQVFGMKCVLDCPEAIQIVAQRREEKERLAAQRAAGQEPR